MASSKLSTGGGFSSNGEWDSRYSSPLTRQPHPMAHTSQYYGYSMLGGVLACGLTHTAVVPLDVAKCRIQVFPESYKNAFQAIRKIVVEEGITRLGLGWFPTLVGYSMQGLCKFGFYEFFKDYYSNLVGEEAAAKNKGLIWVTSSASAEFFADIALCPLEMIKVKQQTSPKNTWPTSFFPAASKMIEQRSSTKFPYGSLVPLWTRQIPYTVAKFFFFERTVQFFYDNVLTQPKDSYSKATQLSVTFTSGYLAGIICAAVSQPADNLVSQMAKAENKGKGFSKIMQEVGIGNLMKKGIGARIAMVGTLTGLQWWIYDTFKTTMGMGTTGGGSAKK